MNPRSTATAPPPAGRNPTLSSTAILLLAALVWLLSTGCATPPPAWVSRTRQTVIQSSHALLHTGQQILKHSPCAEPIDDEITGPSFRPTNFHHEPAPRLAQIRRVLVLPLTLTDEASTSDAGRLTLQPIIAAELGKTKQFELIHLTRAQLQQWTGRPEWTAENPIAPETLGRLREETAAEAVLFSRLTHYRPYPPLAVGWNLKLVSLHDARILWAIDEVFDAGDPTVATAARHYYRQHHADSSSLADSRSMLISPGRFARYAAHATFASLPVR